MYSAKSGKASQSNQSSEWPRGTDTTSTYDELGQVVSGKRYWSDGTPVAGQQIEYIFDDIGDRKSTSMGGDQYGANLHTAGYTNNALNQLTSRSVPGHVDI